MTSHPLVRRPLALTVLLMLCTIGSSVAFTAPNDSLSETDVLFVFDASLSNVAEIELARLAAQQANRGAVRTFAEHMIADHTTAQQELVDLALASGLDLPAHLRDLPEETAAPPARNQLSFDLAYLKGQVLAHQRALELFSTEATKGSHPAIRQYAQSKIPALLEHLAQAYLIISGAQAPAMQ
jgi:putative membrane protein